MSCPVLQIANFRGASEAVPASIAVWVARNVRAEARDLKLYCCCSRRRVRGCKFSIRLFSRRRPGRSRRPPPHLSHRQAIQRQHASRDPAGLNRLISKEALQQRPRRRWTTMPSTLPSPSTAPQRYIRRIESEAAPPNLSTRSIFRSLPGMRCSPARLPNLAQGCSVSPQSRSMRGPELRQCPSMSPHRPLPIRSPRYGASGAS